MCISDEAKPVPVRSLAKQTEAPDRKNGTGWNV